MAHATYYDFTYQYMTSMVASTSLARAVREEAETANDGQDALSRRAYLRMLSSGSQYAIDLLAMAST